MSDANNVWPPPPSHGQEPPEPPRYERAAVVSFGCFLAGLLLTIVLVVGARIRLLTGAMIVGELGLSIALLLLVGVGCGVRGRRCRQGKVGLYGSMLVIGSWLLLLMLVP